ncbi:MAG: flagellar hook-length control protein FliK [Lachnospiraceae bacterium]|nr:flagellar hook-length control protein FliK [Lachnospiraceae bacterium]
MTSASIMEVSKTGFAISGSAVKTPAVNTDVQFSDAMEFASAPQQEDGAQVAQSSDVKAHAEKNAAQHTGRKEIREVDQTESKAEVSEEEISDEMKAKEEEIVKEIAQKFGVSEEEVREVMEMLGFQAVDLLSQGNMVSLVAQLTDMQPVDVLTDGNLFAQITEVTTQVQEQLQTVADELGVSLEQLQTMVEKQMQAGEVIEAVPQTYVNEDVAEAETVAEPEMPVTAQPEESKEEPKQVAAKEETVAAVANSVEDEKPEMAGQQKKSDAGEPELMQQGQNVQVLKGDIKAEIPGQNTPVFERSMDIEQTRELINQIADYVKVSRSETISSMEIQLHPVELGTVNLEVVAKDGNVSARLAVQDEAVRAALESQVTQLRETLQEQGLKIDAVEVTVATHEFEQNLDQHGREAEEQAAKEKKNGRKILDLNEMEEEFEDGDMSEADRLQVEMMRMGGNRLSLRV